MLSLVDCIAFSGLTPDQLDAVACFKHLPPIVAAEWGELALETKQGRDEVESILRDECRFARQHHLACAKAWSRALSDFRRTRLH